MSAQEESTLDHSEEAKSTTSLESEKIADSLEKVSLSDTNDNIDEDESSKEEEKEEESSEEEEEEIPNDGTRKIVLKSCDGGLFEVSESAIRLSDTIQHMIEDVVVDAPIPIQNVKSEILAKVIAYCKKHAYRKFRDEEKIKKWDKKFVAVDQRTLQEILLAANFLGIEGLLSLASKEFASLIQDKSVEEVRAIFGIVNDFTPEEEEKIRRENPYGFA